MKLSLGFSTCPNDTFIFDALVHNKIDTEGLEFELVMTDVEELNKMAFENKLDITKLSYHAYAYLANSYQLLTTGSALGRKNGPLLISKQSIQPNEVENLKIAIPGKYTTANMLFSIQYPNQNNTIKTYLFSEIEDAILNEEVDAGVIIHENRFTYQKKGLKKIADLGELWEEQTGFPIPLGGIAVNRALDIDLRQKINRVLERSVKYAFEFPNSSNEFVEKYAKEMEKETLEKHIDLYVNNFTINLGEEGKAAVKYLINNLKKQQLISLQENIEIFIN